MVNYGHIYSSEKPQEVEMTNTLVFVASNIQPFSRTLDDRAETGFEYDCICYTKDEYIHLMATTNAELQTELLNTQMALCEIYELLEGGE